MSTKSKNKARNTKKRQYNRITPTVVAAHVAAKAFHGNGSAAVRALTPTVLNPGDRAYRLRKLAEQETPSAYIDTQMEQIGIDAINRLGKLVNSDDERVASNVSKYVVDHIKGKAVTRSIGVTARTTIQSVLD